MKGPMLGYDRPAECNTIKKKLREGLGGAVLVEGTSAFRRGFPSSMSKLLGEAGVECQSLDISF